MAAQFLSRAGLVAASRRQLPLSADAYPPGRPSPTYGPPRPPTAANTWPVQ